MILGMVTIQREKNPIKGHAKHPRTSANEFTGIKDS